MRGLLLSIGLAAVPWLPRLQAQEATTTTAAATTTEKAVPQPTPAVSVFSTMATTGIPGVNPGDLVTDAEGCYLYKPSDDQELALKLCDVSQAQDVYLYEGASFMWVNGTLTNQGTVSICDIEFDSTVMKGVLMTVPDDVLSRPGDEPLTPGETLAFNFLLPVNPDPADPNVPEAADLYLSDSWSKCKPKAIAEPTQPPTEPPKTTTTPPAPTGPKFTNPAAGTTTTTTTTTPTTGTSTTTTVPDAAIGTGEASASKEDAQKKATGTSSPAAPGLRPLPFLLSAVVVLCGTLVVTL